MSNAARNLEDIADGHENKDEVDLLEPRLINLMQQSEALVNLMRGFFAQLDRKRSEEFKAIAGYIAKAKEEIRELRPNDLSQERIPTAGAELDAIVQDTEFATHNIMDTAEAILALDPSDSEAYKAAVDGEVFKIFEYCSFQDITGQRVSKIVSVLQQIEERVTKLAQTLGVEDKEVELSEREKRARDLMLHGPAIGGPEVKQDAIDSMFAEVGEAPPKAASVAPEAKAPTPKVAPEKMPEPAQNTKPVLTPKPAPAPESDPDSDANKSNSQADIDALFD